MKLLLDANIFHRLITKLQLYFDDRFHVDDIGISIPPKDIEIWKFALDKNLLIVTNDNDFLNLAEVKGFPPKVVLLRTGNQSNNFIESILIKHKADIFLLHQSTKYGILEIF